jgi:hypothetical protein
MCIHGNFLPFLQAGRRVTFFEQGEVRLCVCSRLPETTDRTLYRPCDLLKGVGRAAARHPRRPIARAGGAGEGARAPNVGPLRGVVTSANRGGPD